MGMGGALLTSHLGISDSVFRAKLDEQGNINYSPLYKEYTPTAWPLADELKAKLNANENPHGPSPKAFEALAGSLGRSNRYAWKELYGLIDKIADYEGVQKENIFMGPGSSDILEKTAMVLFQHGGNVVSADPAYMSLVKVAQAVGAEWKSVPLASDWSHDLDAMEAAMDEDTKLVYICNPNNPTGTITDAQKLKSFCERVSEKVTVFVDEAYLDFIEDGFSQSMASLVSAGKNIIVARTFSKIHGMAGLRVGYAVATEEILEDFRKITRGGMGISYPSVHAAMASMDDANFLIKSRELNKMSRHYTISSLIELGHEPVPSHTSFLIFPIPVEGKPFLEQMYDQQVAVRAFQFKDQNWCRVSVGTSDEMRIFINTIEKVLA